MRSNPSQWMIRYACPSEKACRRRQRAHGCTTIQLSLEYRIHASRFAGWYLLAGERRIPCDRTQFRRSCRRIDDGVLNISLIFEDEKKGIDIDKGYEAMVELMRRMLRPYNAKIEAYEIEGSYCPGSYDLSINGKKFAGISQRRVRGGVAVQIYLCADKSGSERADLIRRFYQAALKDKQNDKKASIRKYVRKRWRP